MKNSLPLSPSNSIDPVEIGHAIIIGGSARGLAQSAQLAGFKVITVDHFCDHDTKQVSTATISLEEPGANPGNYGLDNSIRPTVDRCWPSANDAVFAYVGGMENQSDRVAELQRLATLVGNTPDTLIRLRDKSTLHSFLIQHGFRVPLTFPLQQVQRLVADWESSDDLPQQFLKKKWASCGGLDVTMISQEELADHSEDSKGSDYCFQEFVPGRNLSAAFVACNRALFGGSHDASEQSFDAMLIGITEQLSGDSRFNAPGFHYCGSIVEPSPSAHVLEYARQIGQLVANEYGLVGLFNIDFIESDGECYFLEINPRYSASMEVLERQTGINFFLLQYHFAGTFPATHLALSNAILLDEISNSTSFQPAPNCEWIWGKAVWYAERPYVISEEFPGWATRQKDALGHPLIADIPTAESRIQVGMPVFTVFASGDSCEQVAEKLVQTAKMFASKI